MENEGAIIQAMMELSAQLKDLKTDMTSGFTAVKEEISGLKDEISILKTDIEKLSEKVETIDAKFDVLSLSLITTQADVLRLKRA